MQSSESEVASVRATLSRAKEQAFEEFRGSEDFKEELLASSRLAYLIGYEDGRDAIGKVYPDLDLSHVAIPDSEGEETNKDHELVEVAPTEKAEEVPIGEAPIGETPTDQTLAIAEPAPASEETALEPP